MSDDGHTVSSHDDATRRPADEGGARATFRLPPPAFPPGARRRQVAQDLAAVPSGLGGAFISPDDPIPPRSETQGEGYISPDEPIVRSHGADRAETGSEEGVVTGIGDGPPIEPADLAVAGDPYVAELVDRVSKLAEDLKRRGEAGLRTGREMSRFDVTLRAYCVGYLAGRRAWDQEE